MKPKGPFVAHIRWGAKPLHNKPARTASVEFKTFKGAENYLSGFSENVEARWVTNADGQIRTRYDRGTPDGQKQIEANEAALRG